MLVLKMKDAWILALIANNSINFRGTFWFGAVIESGSGLYSLCPRGKYIINWLYMEGSLAVENKTVAFRFSNDFLNKTTVLLKSNSILNAN